MFLLSAFLCEKTEIAGRIFTEKSLSIGKTN